jgi:hypothetical protein
MKAFRTISKLNLSIQLSVALCLLLFSLSAIFIVKVPILGTIFLISIALLSLLQVLYKSLFAVYEFRFENEITLRTLFGKFNLKYSDICGMANSKLKLKSKSIPLWYPVYGQYAIGSEIAHFDEIFHAIRANNRELVRIEKPKISAQKWIAAAIIGIVSTLVLLLSGIIPNLNTKSVELLLPVYLANVIIIALLLQFLRKNA